jgi:DNA-binding transcriptional MerR regulator
MMAVQRYDIVLYRREAQQLTLDMLAAHAGMHPALVQQLVEFGLIEPVERQEARSLFDASAVPRLRMIGRLRESLGINLAGIAVILDLRDRLCALQRENETLRSRY